MSDSDAPSKESPSSSRRRFIKYGVAGALGAGVASAVEIPVLSSMLNSESMKVQEANSQIEQLNSQLQQNASQINSLQSQIAGDEGLITLSLNEQRAVEAIVETIIPTDENGPGAKEAGVIYFIDRQLATDYGNNARMYMKGPFVLPGQAGPLTVDGITYPQGSPAEPYQGPAYQYNMAFKEFWRYGLQALEIYSNQAYGGNFENLTSDQKKQVLTDLYDNKPTAFNGIIPRDFFNEVIFMTYSGFLMDPMYGGNKGMVGWALTGFTGANMADSFNEGRNVMQLMVADTPTRFPPHSAGEFQKMIGTTGGN